LRAGVDKETRVKDLQDGQIDSLYTALNNIAVAIDQERRPAVILQEGRAIDVTPIELWQYREMDRREFPTFNEALSHFLTIAEPQVEVRDDVAAKFERRIAQQRETLQRLREEAMLLEAQAVKAAKNPRIKATKAMWFEAYRWTLSSDGNLILGGRDARTNDQLVKKHLKEGDRYAHADIHGAPSTVIKDGARAPETTLREACEFALAYSKAWSAGLASGSAYWVLPEQVSKQSESG